MKTYYFMAGLPRSGSTVLSAILNQNPKFYSGPSSPVLSTMYAVENHLRNDELFHGFPKPEQANLIISNIIHQFYSDVDKEIVIDKNRAWPMRIPYIEGYIHQKAKILCPVRDTEEILSSLIRMIHRNPYQEGQPRINFVDEQLVKLNIPINDENRCDYIASSQGILGLSLSTIAESIQQGFRDRIHFIEYNDLIQNPQDTMNKIYEFLEEESYEHTFDNLINSNPENDLNTYGLSDMHEVRTTLKNISPNPSEILPESILQKCQGSDFWRRLNSINNNRINIIK